MPVLVFDISHEPKAKKFDPKKPTAGRNGQSPPFTSSMSLRTKRSFPVAIGSVKNGQAQNFRTVDLAHLPTVNFVSASDYEAIKTDPVFKACIKNGSIKAIEEVRTSIPGKCLIDDFYLEMKVDEKNGAVTEFEGSAAVQVIEACSDTDQLGDWLKACRAPQLLPVLQDRLKELSQ
jgi:hypothetical protein